MDKHQEHTEQPTASPTDDLSASEGWLRGLVEQTLAGIYIIQDGCFRYVNQGFADIFGYAAPADLIDKVSIGQLIAPEDRQKVAENVRLRTEEKVKDMRYTFTGLHLEGHRIEVEVHGRNMEFRGRPAVIGLILDVTERKQAEAARLAEAAMRVTASIFEAQEAMIVTDAELLIVRVNRAFTESTELTPEEAIGQNIRQLLLSQRYDAVFFGAMQASIERTGSWKGELWTRRKSGEDFPGLATVTAVKGDTGEVTHHVVTLTDITERKRLESEMVERIEELKTLNERLEDAHTQLLQSEKMAAVGQLAAGIAHEINNPVGFVNSNLGTLNRYLASLMRLIDAYQQLAEGCPPDDPAVQQAKRLGMEIDIDYIRADVVSLLNESTDGLERVKRIVADLKDFSRVGEAKWQPANIHKCLDSTLNVVANELKYKATVTKNYGTLPEIMCMPFQLNQVFMNLLVNAAHAIKEHGTITLRTGCADKTVWIEVEDNGSGIPAENLKRIFEPFFTTKPVGSGTGLGLSVSYGIVQKHKGKIDVRSEPGNGTTFRVTLPINQDTVGSGPEDGKTE
jgi:two-component system NtrC family sensor kinase